MSFDPQSLYQLLPEVYRIRDAEQGYVLRELLSLIATQTGVLDENLEQLLDDQFIETCADWVIPYIGDLIGYRPLNYHIPGIGSPRAEVANTIGYRRRKGTAAVLEQLARDVTGWNARAVEFFQLLATTQSLNHLRPEHLVMPDLREWEPLERLGTAFDKIAHTADVRSATNGRGRYNIANVGIFLWRQDSYGLLGTAAAPADGAGLSFWFNPLGFDTPLVTRPETEDEITHIAEPINVPQPISHRVLAEYRAEYYGEGKSIFIAGWTDLSKIVVCDLSDWSPALEPKTVAIDPQLGRIKFAEAPLELPAVTYSYGSAGRIGGGDYGREESFYYPPAPEGPGRTPLVVTKDASDVQAAIDRLGGDGVVEIQDNWRYPLASMLTIKLVPNQHVELRAADGCRPVLRFPPESGGSSVGILVSGGPGALILNGLVIAGGMMTVEGDVGTIELRHCTLVPAADLPSLSIQPPSASETMEDQPPLRVEIDHCILGSMQVDRQAEVAITSSIIDACDRSKSAYVGIANDWGGKIQISNSTVIGTVKTALLELASNSILLDTVEVQQRQKGCVRYCYLPRSSSALRRFRCQPCLALEQEEAARKLLLKQDLTNSEIALLETQVDAGLVPVFDDLNYGRPGYAQLSLRCPVEIRTGADDGAELGAFHNNYEPQREQNLRTRLDEYLRFGLVAGIFHET